MDAIICFGISRDGMTVKYMRSRSTMSRSSRVYDELRF